MFSLNDNRPSVSGPKGEGACFGFVHSQLFAAQDNIKRSGDSTSLGWPVGLGLSGLSHP